MQDTGVAPPTVSYLKLIRTSQSLRRSWYGQLVSQPGDWFDSIAFFGLGSLPLRCTTALHPAIHSEVVDLAPGD